MPPDQAPAPSDSTDQDESPYEILEELGRGPHGVTFRARERATGSLVALKELHGNLPEGPALGQLQEYVQVLIALSHIGIGNILAAGMVGQKLFLVSELISGYNMRAYLDLYGPLDNALALSVLRQATMGLEYGHQRNIPHGSVKPENIFLIAGGLVKLSDFGIARLAYLMVGSSPTYDLNAAACQPPERRQQGVIDAVGDIYALGAVAYQLVSGALPYAAAEPAGKDAASRFGYLEIGARTEVQTEPELKDLRELAPTVSDPIYNFAMSALRREPHQRPAHVNVVQQILAGQISSPTAAVAAPRGVSFVPTLVGAASATPPSAAIAPTVVSPQPKCRLCPGCKRPVSPMARACLLCGRLLQAPVAEEKRSPLHQRADDLFSAGQFLEAAAAYAEAAQQEPNNAHLVNEYGDVLAILKRFGEARATYEHALRLDPSDADARHDLGLVLLTLGDTNAAWEQFHYVLRSNPSIELELSAKIALGAVCAGAGDLSGAAKFWNGVLKVEPNIAPVHYSLGTIYAHLGTPDLARQEWQTCLRLDPHHHEAAEALAALEAQRVAQTQSDRWRRRSTDTLLRRGLFGIGGLLGALWDDW